MIQALHYERAKVLFKGGWRYRSWKAMLIAVPVGTAFVVAGAILWQLPAWQGKVLGGVSIVLGAMAIAAQGFYAILNVTRDFELRSDGIQSGRKLAPWEAVRRLSAFGSPKSRRIRLFYIGRWGAVHHLLTHRNLAPVEYEALIAILREEIGGAHPNVVLGGYERESNLV
jgi:hypothetical protein